MFLLIKLKIELNEIIAKQCAEKDLKLLEESIIHEKYQDLSLGSSIKSSLITLYNSADNLIS